MPNSECRTHNLEHQTANGERSEGEGARTPNRVSRLFMTLGAASRNVGEPSRFARYWDAQSGTLRLHSASSFRSEVAGPSNLLHSGCLRHSDFTPNPKKERIKIRDVQRQIEADSEQNHRSRIHLCKTRNEPSNGVSRWVSRLFMTSRAREIWSRALPPASLRQCYAIMIAQMPNPEPRAQKSQYRSQESETQEPKPRTVNGNPPRALRDDSYRFLRIRAQ
jgi:hypothetical protein